MKKITSLLLAGIMLFGLIPATAVTATGDTVDEGLVFELDLSGYDATLEDDATKGITNTVADSGSSITVSGAPVASAIGSFTTKKALTFKDGTDDTTAANTNTNGIKVIDADFLDKNEMTFEFWAKGTELGTSTKSYRLFAMSGSQGVIDTYGYNGAIWWRPGGDYGYGLSPDNRYNATSFADMDGEWAHYVFTRKWTPAAANDGTGTWSGDLYINGTKVTPKEIPGKDAVVTRRAEPATSVLALGNNGSCNSGFYGSIADVRVYTTVLSDASIVQKYTDTKGEFVQFEHTQAKAGVRVLEKTEEAQNLDVKAGTIELEFTESVADADLNKILFTKSNGDPIVGECSVTKSGAKVIVSYPALELDGNYRLIVPNNLTSALGETIKAGATYIFTAIVDEKLVFDLDLSNFNASGTGAKGIVNTVEGNDSEITVMYTPAEVAIGSFTTKKALSFRNSADANGTLNNAIKVVDSDFLNQNEMTFEFWAKGDEIEATSTINSQRMGSMGIDNKDSGFRWDTFIYTKGSMWHRPGGKQTSAQNKYSSMLANYDGEWAHYVYTRKWTPSTANDGTGNWSGDFYVNGVKLTPNESTGVDAARENEENMFFTIGNQPSNGAGFYGSIGDVKVYNSILSDASVAQKYEDTVGDYYPFTAGDVKLGGSALAQTQDIDSNPGELVLEFSEPVAEEELDKITFKKAADGAAIKGVCIKEVSSKNVIIKYGRLEEDVTYTLTIPEGLKSKLGETLSEGKTYTLTARKKYLYTEDFSGSTVPSGKDANGTQWLQYQSNSVVGDISAMSMGSAGGDGYLSVKPGASDGVKKDYSVSVKWKENIDYNKADTNTLYVIESKISSVHTKKADAPEADADQRRVARDFHNVNGYNFKLGEYHYDNVQLYQNRDKDNPASTNGSINLVKDDNGFTNTRFVVRNYQIDNETKFLGYEIQDLNNTSVYYDNYIPSKTCFESKSGDVFPKRFSSLKLSHIYTQAADTYDAENRYSDIKVYTRPCTEILDISEYNKITRTVDVALTSDIPDAEKENIVVLDSLGNEVENITRTYNAAARTVTLAFGSAAGDDYTVSIENVRDADGFMCTQDVAVFSASEPYAVVQYLDGNDQAFETLEGATAVKVTAVLKNWENAAPLGIFAVYDNDCLVGTTFANGTANGNVFEYSASISGLPALSANATVKLFMWKSLGNIAPALETNDFTGGSL